ncbi:MAG: BolA family protein [Pseudomonadota bacterium]|nr:BolA family protein [Pseudomonadota bacterium]
MNERVETIKACLEKHFQPDHLEVIDESHLHIGHAGAQSGKGHFAVVIVAAAFADQRPLARHRMIYDALGELMKTDIHALRIQAKAPAEAPGSD